ncbi:MAG: bifunctional hydroxymethylpyrimidine kinase/phosphomethylpyrimidine kinase [Bacteroidales bacterium]|jgi:hydroxymethylpyrimidine/phosphomethylpyrimidine kinase|nr:bifunctional hydroxymethylpyrimidine kinase/phosphomethylpyrimidine kinase [Bacteroidales bacterium]
MGYEISDTRHKIQGHPSFPCGEFNGRVLTIAGSDSGAGAGVQADLKTISACGGYATTAITAITAQNTLEVAEVFSLPAHIVLAQITAVLSDIGTDAIKIGMLQSAEIIETVARILNMYDCKNIVLDPVMISTSGHSLLSEGAIETLKQTLLYSARIITPNLPEMAELLQFSPQTVAEMTQCARELSQGKTSVLLKAGHCEGAELTDVLYNNETQEVLYLTSPRVHTKNTHGTGCTLSSAIAAFLAQNYSLNDAVLAAKNYLHAALERSGDYTIGNGSAGVNHFFAYSQSCANS